MRNVVIKLGIVLFSMWFVLASWANMNGNANPSPNAGDDKSQTTKEYSRDAWITTKIKAALARASNITATDVTVTTHNQVVQLSGFVDTHQQIAEIEKIAREVEGVRKVINNLKVKPAALPETKNN